MATDPHTPEIPETGANAPASSAPQGDPAIRNDIAKILQEVKLPERREARTSGDKKPGFENLTATLTEKPIEAKPLPEVPDPEKPKLFDIPSLHTLKDDLQDVVTKRKISLVRAVSLEEEKRVKRDAVAKATAPAHTPGPAARRVMRSVFISIVFVGIGILAFGAMAFISTQRKTDIPATTPALMFSERSLSFPVEGEGQSPYASKQQLSLARTQVPLTLGAIARIVPTVIQETPDGDSYDRAATAIEFLRAIGAGAPEELARALGDEFFLGMHAVDENVPVLVLTVRSYQRAFAAMLAWENSINEGLSPLFSPLPSVSTQPDGTLKARVFEDVVVKNFDVRVLKDQSGVVRFLYSFPSPDILIIAENPLSFTETLARLRAERRL